MAKVKQTQLPGCKPMPMKFKETPTVNGSGQPLGLCERCDGDGRICTGQKNTTNKLGATVVETLGEFSGKFQRQREKSGYVVSGQTCPDCKGAGLLRKGVA